MGWQYTFDTSDVLFRPLVHSCSELFGSASTAMSMPGFVLGTGTSQVTVSHLPERSTVEFGLSQSTFVVCACASATWALPSSSSSRPRLHRLSETLATDCPGRQLTTGLPETVRSGSCSEMPVLPCTFWRNVLG